MIEHKGFLIEPIEISPGRWRAKISHRDERKIRMAVTGAKMIDHYGRDGKVFGGCSNRDSQRGNRRRLGELRLHAQERAREE